MESLRRYRKIKGLLRKVVMERLSRSFAICDGVLDWLRDYLSGRHFTFRFGLEVLSLVQEICSMAYHRAQSLAHSSLSYIQPTSAIYLLSLGCSHTSTPVSYTHLTLPTILRV